MGKTLRGSPRMRIAMLIVLNSNISSLTNYRRDRRDRKETAAIKYLSPLCGLGVLRGENV
jgi:hypothetical protein